MMLRQKTFDRFWQTRDNGLLSNPHQAWASNSKIRSSYRVSREVNCFCTPPAPGRYFCPSNGTFNQLPQHPLKDVSTLMSEDKTFFLPIKKIPILKFLIFCELRPSNKPEGHTRSQEKVDRISPHPQSPEKRLLQRIYSNGYISVGPTDMTLGGGYFKLHMSGPHPTK